MVIIFLLMNRSYSRLNSLGYFHFKVNHKHNFVNPATGVHMNNVEAY